MNIHEKMSRWGGWFFRQRGFIPVPFFVVFFFLSWGEYENDLLIWPLGSFFLILGTILRGWAAKHIGKYSRTRKRQCKRVVMSGPYALTRNPLYLGNLFILIGFILMSELLWILPIVLPFFLFYYTCIIFWEEGILREAFPEETERYFAKVHRWGSVREVKERWKDALLQGGNSSLREVIYRERRTWQFLIIMTLLFLFKESYNNHHYSIWIPFIFN